MLKKLKGVLFSYLLQHIPIPPITQTRNLSKTIKPITLTLPYNQNSIKMTEEISQMTEMPVEKKAPRKRRTPEEIAAEKVEKEQKRLEREDAAKKRADAAEVKRQRAELAKQRKELHSTSLEPGKGLFAKAAMTLFEACRQNMPRTNLAFRHMFASRLIFPPKKNINKFATGGVAEECASQLFCDLGFDCVNMSEDVNVIDLAIKVPTAKISGREAVGYQGFAGEISEAQRRESRKSNDTEIVEFKVSLKNSGKLSAQPILENYRGQKRPEIRELPPTIVIYTETDAKRARMVYLDEEILLQGYPDLTEHEFKAEIYANSDSNLTFKSGFLAKFIPRLPAEYILDAEFPEEFQGLEERNFSRLALAEVVRQLDAAK